MSSVIIIDDSTFMRRMMKRILTANGYTVIAEASNGKDGVERYKENNPDIVTMDVVMDEMDGLEALKQIMAYNPAAKVVMVSSMGQEIVVREAIMAGAKGFIFKPFEESLVIDVLRRLSK